MRNRDLIGWIDVWYCILGALALTLFVCGGAYLGAGGPMPWNTTVSPSAVLSLAPAAQVELPGPPRTMHPVTTALLAQARAYRVRPGDTLSKLSIRFYRRPDAWTVIYWANHRAIKNPNVIMVGQLLTIPPLPKKIPAPPHMTVPAAVVSTTRFATQSSSIPISTGGVLTPAQVESLWAEAGGPVWAEPKAEEIAYCESGNNPRAYNPSGASGVWQILGQVVPGNIFDPYVNALNAVTKFKAAGDTFAPWVCQ